MPEAGLGVEVCAGSESLLVYDRKYVWSDGRDESSVHTADGGAVDLACVGAAFGPTDVSGDLARGSVYAKAVVNDLGSTLALKPHAGSSY